MNHLYKMRSKWVLAALVLTIGLALLTACALVKPITICHATGDTANPYVALAVNSVAMNEHRGHPNDIIPAPDCDCPKGPGTASPGTTSLVTTGLVTNSLVTTSDSRVTIWHATGSQTNPYTEIAVSVDGLEGHGQHEGDIIPAPACECPKCSDETSSGTTSDGKITIWHATGSQTNPYAEITVSVNGLNGHGQHEGDIIPAPACDCPKRPDATSPGTTSDRKITICHATGSQSNPYTEITVSVNGLNGHGQHEGDIIPAPTGGCPIGPVATSPGTTSDRKITICHATGSQSNPYTEITVSVNGLNGHGKHEGDIIPAPVGGCPSTGEGKPGNGKSGNDKSGNDNPGNKK